LRVLFLLFIEHVESLAPPCLLAIIDLAKVEYLALSHFARLQTPVLYYAEIAVLLTVFVPLVAA
jgi:hypothetical protein